jgi:two-component system chemotaxis sensor kinase CheA
VSTAASLTQLAGRGVGMSAVYRAVLDVGGKMTVHSEPGKGTSFEITVPVGEDAYVAPLVTNIPPANRGESLRLRGKPVREMG